MNPRSGEVPPRLHCLPASGAPIAAVLLRGPSQWSHVGRWHLDTGRYEPGAWLHGRLFPRRSDLSPDGRWLCAFAHRPGSSWEHGDTYVAVSKLPWLTALHAFGTCGTWTRGYHFTDEPAPGPPAGGTWPLPYGLQPIACVQFANERRRGWEETADCPRRAPTDAWDQWRNARLQKRQPGGERLLLVESLGWAGGAFGVDQAVDGLRVNYWLEAEGDLQPMPQFQWADWDASGRLLAATRSGRLQIHDLDSRSAGLLCDEDLTGLMPSPVPAPVWAQRW